MLNIMEKIFMLPITFIDRYPIETLFVLICLYLIHMACMMAKADKAMYEFYQETIDSDDEYIIIEV